MGRIRFILRNFGVNIKTSIVMKTILTSLDKEELKELFKETVLDIIQTLPQNNQPEDEILCFHEVCDYLKLSRGSVYKLIDKGLLPSFKLNGKRKFLKSEVLEAIQKLSNNNL